MFMLPIAMVAIGTQCVKSSSNNIQNACGCWFASLFHVIVPPVTSWNRLIMVHASCQYHFLLQKRKHIPYALMTHLKNGKRFVFVWGRHKPLLSVDENPDEIQANYPRYYPV
jgi:hypothetical protein